MLSPIQTVSVAAAVNDKYQIGPVLDSIRRQGYTRRELCIIDKPLEPFIWTNTIYADCMRMNDSYNVLTYSGKYWEDIQKLIFECKRDYIVILNEHSNPVPDMFETVLKQLNSNDNTALFYHSHPVYGINCIFARTRLLREVSGVDKHYKTLCDYPWLEVFEKLLKLGYDVKEMDGSLLAPPQVKVNFPTEDIQHDHDRYIQKINDPLYGKNIVYVDGAMGDHLFALPLIRQSKGSYICCKFPHIYNEIEGIRGFVAPNHPLFGDGGYNVYAYGQHHGIFSIDEAFSFMYNRPYYSEDFKFENVANNSNINSLCKQNKVVVIAPFASNIHGFSNKNWPEIRWFELIDWLKRLGYYVVQVGSKNDRQIPNANLHFLDQNIHEVAQLIIKSEFWISVDTFQHHLASALRKPGICLTPDFNEHAQHNRNLYVVKSIGKNWEERRWNIDAQIPERKESMESITIDDTKQAVFDFLGTHEYLFKPITNQWLVEAKASALQVPSEIEGLQKYLMTKLPEVIVEIGTQRGGTLARWIEMPTVKTLISIDLVGGVHGGMVQENRDHVISNTTEECKRLGIEFHEISGDSHDVASVKRLEEILNGRLIDFLFIDGDHRYEGVRDDYMLYNKFVREEGIVAFHDIRDSEWHRRHSAHVDMFWNKLKCFFTHKEWIATREESCAIMPDATPHGFGGIGAVVYNKAGHSKFEKRLDVPRTVSITIGAFNNCDATKACLDSLFESECLSPKSQIVDVVVHSNGSTDGTSEMLMKYMKIQPKLHAVFSNQPLGYARAVNFPIQLTRGNYVVYLNNDTRPFGDWLDRLIDPMDLNPKLGLCGPMIGVPYTMENGYEVKPYVLGMCEVVKRHVLEEIGLLAESWKIGYHEDEEFSTRVKNAGYEIHGIVDQSTIGHWDEYTTAGIPFPIHHAGGITFNHQVPNLTEIQQLNHEKWKNYLTPHNKKYVVIPDSAEFLLTTIKRVTEEDRDCMICAVVATQELMNEIFFHPEHELIYQTHVHVIPAILTSRDIHALKNVGRVFFAHDDDHIFYVTNKNVDNPIDITWLCKWDDYSSMGILSQKLLENIPKNVEFEVQGIIGPSTTQNKLIQYKLNNSRDKKNIGIMFSYPDQHQLLQPYKKKIIYTGADTNGGIPNFGQNANHADVLFTPSNLSRSFMKGLETTKPIFVVPHGVDTDLFKYNKREINIYRPFTFLYVGECSDRKGVFQLVQAFQKIDSAYKVRLILAGNTDMTFYGGEDLKQLIAEDERITLLQQNVPQTEIANLMQISDCYVYPSRADTFGMTVLEAMSCGLPVIANDGLGVSEFIEGRYIPIKTTKVDVANHPWMRGQWLESSVSDLCNKMEDVYDKCDRWLDAAEDNAAFIRERFTWKRVANDLSFFLSIIDNNTPKKKISVIIPSFNRPKYLVDMLASIEKQYRINESPDYEYDIHVVEQSKPELQAEIATAIANYVGKLNITLHSSMVNYGQRGMLLKLFEMKAFENSDYIMMSDQDNIYHKPLSTYCKVLDSFPDCFCSTGYLSKEHVLNDVIVTSEFGTLLRKSGAREGHMTFRAKDVLDMMPIAMDSQFGNSNNGAWFGCLGWELLYWNEKSPGNKGKVKFVYAVPCGVEHVGYSSTYRDASVEEILRCETPMEDQKWISGQELLQCIQPKQVEPK